MALKVLPKVLGKVLAVAAPDLDTSSSATLFGARITVARVFIRRAFVDRAFVEVST